MLNPFKFFFPLLLMVLGGCETTEQSRKWQEIPHEKSEPTIVSDVFDVVRVSRKDGFDSITEIARLTLKGEKVGFVGSQQTTGSQYCGYAQENIWNFFDWDSVKKVRVNAGVPNTDDVKLQSRKNQHGDLYYQDVKGTNKRCMIVSELGLGGLTGLCPGTYFIFGVICRNANSSGVEKLDKQVFQLMNDLSFTGGKKELIKKSSSGPGMGAYTDEEICQFSIDHSGQTLKWDTANSSRFLDEAKRRGLTLDACLKYEATSAAVTTTTSSSSSPDVRPIAFEWEGYGKLIAGQIELNQQKGGGIFSAQLPDNEGRCTGSNSYGSKTTGTWAMSCTDGRAASGTFESFGKNKGSAGVGKDTRGRKVKYTIGAG